MISIKGHEYHSAQSSYQPHDLTYQSFYKTHVSHGNKELSSIAKTNSRGLDAFTRVFSQDIRNAPFPTRFRQPANVTKYAGETNHKI
jgi:hypothetical protein